MRVSEQPRETRVWECDHMRLVVRDDAGRWRHLTITGTVGSDCSAGVYAVEARITGDHTIRLHA